MRHYPAYTAGMVLQEKAILVFTLMEHALREDAATMSRQLTILRASQADPKSDEYMELVANLEQQQSDILEIEGTENDYEAIGKLKNVLH